MKHKPLIGHKLANYQIERLLGHGGMADVYYGWDEKLHRPVAIKVFEAETRARIAQANRFIQEARVMAQWRHDNIVQIYYAGDETGLFYYVMEFVDGYDLASIMSVYADRDELMPIADVQRIGESLASALDYAHARGVIHRDVKPANVMIASVDERLVLGDFGLALDLSNKSQGEVFGSPHYIAPEQARRSSDAVPQSDLYSLGVILYEMLTGATPFNDPSPASLALQHISEPPPLPRSINPALSESVEAVLLKALEKSPSNRYQSGTELMEALGKALAEKPAVLPAGSPSLPPIPVNAPTIQRSNISMSSFTKRRDVIKALEERTATIKRGLKEQDFVPERPSKNSRKRITWVAIGALLLLAFLGWTFGSNLFAASLPWFEGISPTAAFATATSVPILEIASTNSPSPVPDATESVSTPTLIPSLTVTSQPTATQTQVPTASVTSTSTPVATVTELPTETVASPVGYLMTAYYDQTSFYLYNQGDASRSVSGFSFERVNNDDTFQNYFDGWEWETYYVKALHPNRCLVLKINGTSPSLEPEECSTRVLSILNLQETNDKIFWTPNDTSREFRVLWLDVEIARCSTEAGVCKFHIP